MLVNVKCNKIIPQMISPGTIYK